MSDPVASDAFAFVARMAISRASWTAVLTSPAWVVPLKKRYSTVGRAVEEAVLDRVLAAVPKVVEVEGAGMRRR